LSQGNLATGNDNINSVKLECDYDSYSTEQGHQIGWKKVLSCDEGDYNTLAWEESFASLNLESAITLQFLPSDSTPSDFDFTNDASDEFAVMMAMCANPMIAVNRGLTPSWTYNLDTMQPAGQTDLQNWLGSITAKARLSNSCLRDASSFEDVQYHACGNHGGIHLKDDPAQCVWDYQDDLANVEGMSVWLGYMTQQNAYCEVVEGESVLTIGDAPTDACECSLTAWQHGGATGDVYGPVTEVGSWVNIQSNQISAFRVDGPCSLTVAKENDGESAFDHVYTEGIYDLSQGNLATGNDNINSVKLICDADNAGVALARARKPLKKVMARASEHGLIVNPSKHGQLSGMESAPRFSDQFSDKVGGADPDTTTVVVKISYPWAVGIVVAALVILVLTVRAVACAKKSPYAKVEYGDSEFEEFTEHEVHAINAV